MKRVAQAVERALLGAQVLALIATAGWSQSLTWLGTLPGGKCERGFGCFRRRRRGGRRGLQRRRAVACLSLDGFWWDARPRHAGRR
jgi:hypothetical protein